MGIFDYDSPLMETISRITDYIFLTIITLICCIPIVTIGPAFIAKYYVSMKMVRGEEPVVIKSYFRSFKENFKQGVILTLIMLPVVVFFVWDWYLILYTGVKFIPAMKYALGLLTVLTAMAIFSLFPMVARFKITNFEAIKSSFVFALANFLRVLIGIIMIVAPIVIAKYYLKWGWLIMLFASVIMLHLNSMFFVKKFKQVERANAYGDEDDDELYYDELEEDEEDSDEDSEDDAEEADTKEADEKESDVKEAKTKEIAVSKSISEEKVIKKSEDKLENKSNDNLNKSESSPNIANNTAGKNVAGKNTAGKNAAGNNTNSTVGNKSNNKDNNNVKSNKQSSAKKGTQSKPAEKSISERIKSANSVIGNSVNNEKADNKNGTNHGQNSGKNKGKKR